MSRRKTSREFVTFIGLHYSFAYARLKPQKQFFLPMSQERQHAEFEGSGNGLRCERYLVPSCTRNILNCRLVAVFPLEFDNVGLNIINLGADGSFHFWDKDARSRLKST